MNDKNYKYGFDFIVTLFSLILLIISYCMTVNLIDNSVNFEANNTNTITVDTSDAIMPYRSFIRGAFIFLAPCAMEGINLFVTKMAKKKGLDIFELSIGLMSVILCIYLFFVIFMEKPLSDTCADIIKFMLLVYPLKALVNLLDVILQAIRFRYQ